MLTALPVREPPAQIEISDLTHVYSRDESQTVALEGVSLGIQRGEIFTVVGPSGCGKTTLVYAIAGFNKPTAGHILVGGRKVEGPGPDRGVVFQGYALFAWLDVIGNVEFGPKMRGVPSTERGRIASQYIDLVGLGEFKHKYPYELSAGMQQRVAIARALANEPEILLMDEPFGALDAQTREEMQEELLRIWMKTQKTIFFITHSVDEAVFISSRVAVLTARPGRIKAVLEIDLPHPRYDFYLRTSAEFNELKASILTLLRG